MRLGPRILVACAVLASAAKGWHWNDLRGITLPYLLHLPAAPLFSAAHLPHVFTDKQESGGNVANVEVMKVRENKALTQQLRLRL